MSQEWRDKANCKGIDTRLFYPEQGASTFEAKAVCWGCVVREECLAFAIETGERFGIWGATSERQRKRMRAAGYRRGRTLDVRLA